jgi:hypothetical protein
MEERKFRKPSSGDHGSSLTNPSTGVQEKSRAAGELTNVSLRCGNAQLFYFFEELTLGYPIRMRFIFLLIITFTLAGFQSVYGQVEQAATVPDTAKWQKVVLKDGSEFVGHVIEKNAETIVFRTSSVARLEIAVSQIERMEDVEESSMKTGRYWFPNPNATRYLFGPSAINLKRGEGYYQNTWVLLNSFNVGLTDNISIGGGFELLSTFATMGSEEGWQPIFILTPKVGFKVRKDLHLGAGVLYLNVPGIEFEDSSPDRTGLGIAYGIGTYGSLDHNVTFGAGYGFIQDQWADRPILTISGMTRIARKTALVSENWILPVDGYYGIYSYGIRFFGEKLAVDLGFINNADISGGIFIGIPWIDFMVKF